MRNVQSTKLWVADTERSARLTPREADLPGGLCRE